MVLVIVGFAIVSIVACLLLFIKRKQDQVKAHKKVVADIGVDEMTRNED